MNKLITMAIISSLTLSGSVLAQSQNDEDIKSDVQAVDKDNASLQKDAHTLGQHRLEKEQDKANENYGSQAVDSVKIGADHTKIAAKKAEKSIDKKILRHHKRKAKEDTGDSETSATHD